MIFLIHGVVVILGVATGLIVNAVCTPGEKVIIVLFSVIALLFALALKGDQK